jgi:hypothetical protein
MRRWICPGLLLLCLAPLVRGQSEDALRRALESKYVTVKLDLPASHKGVDLHFDREQPFDTKEHYSRIKDYDVGIAQGQRVQISQIKVKDDMIEFQLAGGGFNWSWDTTTQTFSPTSKSSRENELARRIKDETDRDRRRDMQDELDHLRRERDRRDSRRRREVEDYNVSAREHDRAGALRSGSRVNLRFKKRVPLDALTVDGLMRYLAPWVELDEGARDRRPR